MADFFISYNRADREWAEWIAWQLEDAGQTTAIQAWDFRPGSNFVLEMERATQEAKRTIAVLSPDYVNAVYTQPEWAQAFAKDPTGERGTLLPVRVREVELRGLLRPIVYIDLVGRNEVGAREALLAGVSSSRAKPSVAPLFPGLASERPHSVAYVAAEPARFPGPNGSNSAPAAELGAASARRTKPMAVILTALRLEYEAVRAHLDPASIHEEKRAQGTIYERGAFSADGCTWDVGLVEIGAGNEGAATEAERALQYFAPHVAMLVGVAGGLKDVRLGDVVVATKVYGYHSGKARDTFEPRPDVGQSSYDMVQRARAEARKPDWRQRLGSPPPKLAPEVHIAPIAAGEQVVASTRSPTYEFLRSAYGDAIAVEMEGHGFLRALHANQLVSALVIRGVSDLIEKKALADKRGRQSVAARHASALAFQVLAKLTDPTTGGSGNGRHDAAPQKPERTVSPDSPPSSLRTLTMERLIEHFLGGDPIVGTQALHELVVRGDAAEEALFSQPIKPLTTVQVRRRWLRYVASRERTVVARLIERLRDQDRFGDADTAAYLFAGISENRKVCDALYAQLETGFSKGQPTSAIFVNRGPFINVFRARGYAGCYAYILWDCVSKSSFAWKKLAFVAFRAACASFARITGDSWVIEQLITHERRDGDWELSTISDSPEDMHGPGVVTDIVDDSELRQAANDDFLEWRRGEVVDHVLREWSQHAHWRVRDFGAQVLASLGFRRTATPVIEWLRREPVGAVRNSLLPALERSDTTAGADALIERYGSLDQHGLAYLGMAAWRASDRERARAVLGAIADSGGSAAASALVSLARLGHRPPRLSDRLDSHDHYERLNAALAVAYLGEKGANDRLANMRREAAAPLERICLAAALAMLGAPNGAAELNDELVAAAGAEDFEKRVDPFRLHRYLQTAILAGLTAGRTETGVSNAWRAEMEPLDPIPRPVS